MTSIISPGRKEKTKNKVRKPSAFTQLSVLHRITAISLFRESLFFPMSKWLWLLTCSLLLWDHVASTGEAAASITEQLFEIKNKARLKKWEKRKKKKIRYDRQKCSPSAEQGSFSSHDYVIDQLRNTCKASHAQPKWP